MPNRYAIPIQATFMLFFISAVSGGICSAGESGQAQSWKTRSELSYVRTSGNTETESLAGKLDLYREGEPDSYYFEGSVLLAKTGDVESSNRVELEARWERLLTGRLFGTLSAGYIRDRFSGYDYRVYGGPGAGFQWIKTERHRLQTLISLIAYHDEFTSPPGGSKDYPAAKATAKYGWSMAENMTFKEALEYFVSLEDSDNYFADSVTTLEAKLNNHLSLGLNYIVNYANEPPSSEVERTDKTFLTTLIVDY